MSIFDIFRKKQHNENPDKTVLKMVQDLGNGFYAWDGMLYRSDIVRACIKPQTKAIGKIIGKHLYTYINPDGTTGLKVNPRANIRFLLEEPNAFMSGQVFQEKMANQLALNGNAFALILFDQYNSPCGLYPIPATSVEAKYSDEGHLFLKFYLNNGKFLEEPYERIIHLRDDYLNNDLFGESPQEALAGVMESVNTADQGLIKAIKNGAIIKWLLKFTSALRDDDLKQRAEDFAENYLSISNASANLGVAAVNSNCEAEQIKPYDYVPNAAQTDRQVSRIYAFFNTNEKIVHSSYTEDEWVAYYEAKIAPVAQQMAQEYTRKLFSRKERSFGNSIVFEASPLTFASMKTKLSLVQLVDRGVISPNEMRFYFNLAPVEGGDTYLLRKDTGTLHTETTSEGGIENENDGNIGNDSIE